jgi:hypothetical protein
MVEGVPQITLVADNMQFYMVELTSRRAGTWQLREVVDQSNVADDVWCPGTHAELNRAERSTLASLVRRVKEQREQDRVNASRRQQVEAADKALGGLSRQERGRHANATVQHGVRWGGEIDSEAFFNVRVPVDHAEEFARTVARFFEAMKAEDESSPSAA